MGTLRNIRTGAIIETGDGDPPVPAPLTQADYKRAIQAHVDATARSMDYSDGVSVASYRYSTRVDWAAQAVTFVGWRDAVWTQVYALLAAVQAGQTQPPTIADLIADLPVITWPAA